jgi:DNA-binding transcriptional MerR regulator
MDRASDLEKIRKILEVKLIRERLKDLGFSPEEIQTKLTQLGDEQVRQLALKLDELNVGGDGAEAVIIILFLLILTVLIIYLLGYRVAVKKG